jgi:hypothetical protein
MLDEAAAAAYVGARSVRAFLARVKIGQWPPPIRFGRDKRWDVRAIDLAINRLSGLASPNQGEEEALRALHAGTDAVRHRQTRR